MRRIEAPLGASYFKYKQPCGEGEAMNYELDKEVFNETTLRLLGEIAKLYPEQTPVFDILQSELDGRLPVESIDEDDPSRDFTYDFESPNGLSFDNVFSIVGSFPPTPEQYQFLRHFLFQPDLNVRHRAATVVEQRLSHYDKEAQEEFERIIQSDPDPLERLASWMSHSRRFAEEEEIDWWTTFLQDIPIKPQALNSRMSKAEIRQYFAIGKDNFYEPKVAQDKAFRDTIIRATQEQLGTIKMLQKLEREGGLTDEVREKVRKENREIDREIMKAKYSVPHVGIILGQLWRLDQKEIVRAVSSVLNHPEKFSRHSHRDDDIVGRGLLATTFIEDQAAQKVFIDLVLGKSKWQESADIVTALARASYDFDTNYIATKVMPVAQKHKDSSRRPTQRAARSMCYAIARDIGKEKVPRAVPKKLPFFGF